MAFPQVITSSNGNSGGSSTTHVITLPSGIVSGNLCIVLFSNDGAATTSVTTPATGWAATATVAAGTEVRLSMFHRVCDGTEGSTITITTSASESSSWVAYRISGADSTPIILASAAVNAGSTTPDPPSRTATWGAEDNIWFAVAAWDSNPTVSAYPSGYDDNQLTDVYSNSVHGCGIAVASKEAAAASDDPGTFTISASDQWVVFTVVVRPSAVAFNPAFAGQATRIAL